MNLGLSGDGARGKSGDEPLRRERDRISIRSAADFTLKPQEKKKELLGGGGGGMEGGPGWWALEGGL